MWVTESVLDDLRLGPVCVHVHVLVLVHVHVCVHVCACVHAWARDIASGLDGPEARVWAGGLDMIVAGTGALLWGLGREMSMDQGGG
jgi:hypothetical protein